MSTFSTRTIVSLAVTLALAAGTPITLSVEAFNSGGKSAKVDVVVICP